MINISPLQNNLRLISNNKINFKGSEKNNNPLNIPDEYISSKNKTVTILGSSRDTDSIKDTMSKTYGIAKELVSRGYNVLTGCGNKGIMGAAFNGASDAEINSEKPEKNLSILTSPLWGDEDTKHSKVIAKPAKSEADRIQNGFAKASNNFLVFPGGACSIQEASTLIAKNKYRPKNAPPLNIFLVGKDYYKGLKQQYTDMYKAGILGTEPDNLFKVVEPEDVLNNFPEIKS